MKRYLLLILCLSLVLPSMAFASDTSVIPKYEEYNISEYEIYEMLLSMTDNELLEKGFTHSDIDELKNFDITEELKRRANMNNEDLKIIGYNDDEISLLKKTFGPNTLKYQTRYNGGIDSGGLFATLTLKTKLIRKNNNHVQVGFNWYWDKMPIFFGGKEFLAFAWNGTAPSGKPLNVKINTNKSSHQVYIKANRLSSEWKNTDFKVNDVYHTASSEFRYGWRIEDSIAWSEKGKGHIYFEKTGSENIKQIGLNIAYGHTTIGPGGSITFTPPYLNIGFSRTVEKMANVSDVYGN